MVFVFGISYSLAAFLSAFRYGSIDYELSQKLVKVATALPESFIGLRPDGKQKKCDSVRPRSHRDEMQRFSTVVLVIWAVNATRKKST